MFYTHSSFRFQNTQVSSYRVHLDTLSQPSVAPGGRHPTLGQAPSSQPLTLEHSRRGEGTRLFLSRSSVAQPNLFIMLLTKLLRSPSMKPETVSWVSSIDSSTVRALTLPDSLCLCVHMCVCTISVFVRTRLPCFPSFLSVLFQWGALSARSTIGHSGPQLCPEKSARVLVGQRAVQTANHIFDATNYFLGMFSV